MIRKATVGIALSASLLAACTKPPPPVESPHEVESAPVPDAAIGKIPDAGARLDTSVRLDVTTVDASESVDASPTRTARLCVEGPGTHTHIGKGASARDDQAAWARAAKKVNQGLVFTIGESTVTVKADQGGVIEGLDPEATHRVGIRFVSGGNAGGFRLKFNDETARCARYKPFYDTWWLDTLRRRCGPCAAE